MNVSPVNFQSVNYQPNVRKNNYVTFHAAPAASEKLIGPGTNGLRWIAMTLASFFGIKKAIEKKAEPSTPAPAETPAVKPEAKPQPVYRSTEEILNDRVETWEELYAKTEELYKAREAELNKIKTKTGIYKANEYSGAYNWDMTPVKAKKSGKIADSSITVAIGTKLISKYAKKYRAMEKLDWKECWNIPWEDLTNKQKYDFAKYAYESGRIKTNYERVKTGEVDYWEKDVGKHTVEVSPGTPGADHICYTTYKETRTLEGYGRLVDGDNDSRCPWYYEGKDPRPACRALWEMQQNGQENGKTKWPVGDID